MNSRFYNWLLGSVFPFVRLSWRIPRMNGPAYHRGYNILRQGDICFTADNAKLSGFLIPGFVDHACLCVGKSGATEIVEMIYSGFHRITFFDLCHEADRVIIARANWTMEYCNLVANRALSFDGALYDRLFLINGDLKFLYCSELVVAADYENKLRLDYSDLAGLGQKYISPQGLLESYDLTVVFDSAGELEGLTGDQIEWKLKSLNSKTK